MNSHIANIKAQQESAKKVKWVDDYDIERLNEYVTALFNYSRFKKGDRIKIFNAPVITETQSHGWLGYKDRLLKGAPGVVSEVDYYKGKFRYDILFDFDPTGSFCFNESDLEPEGKPSKCKHCGKVR